MYQLRAATFIIAVLVASQSAGCGSAEVFFEQTDTESGTYAGTETLTEASGVPDSFTFTGDKITILSQFGEWEAELTGDVIDDALYARKTACEERFDIIVEVIATDTATVQNTITNSVLAGDNAFDIINASQYRSAQLMTNNVYLNMADAPYISFDRAWWSKKYMDNMSIGDSVYFLAGDISLQLLNRTSCIYFSMSAFENLTGENAETLYQAVLDGKWTLEMLEGYLKDSWRDLNGNATPDDVDFYGTMLMPGSLCEHIVMNSGVSFISFDGNGIPYLDLNMEKMVDVVDRLYKMYHETEGVEIFPGGEVTLNETMVKKLSSNEAVFMFGWFDTAQYLRDMKDDYGVIPYPKYDEYQESYNALVHDNAGLYCVPVTAADRLEEISAFLEYSAYLSYSSITPSFYDVTLKGKYMRDEVSVKILDIIREGITTDFAYVYNYALNTIATSTRSMMDSGNSDYASLWAANETVYENLLQKLINTYLLDN